SYLTTILSCIYAVFIVTLGVVIYISDIILSNSPLAESFSIYLVVLSFGYFLFLYIDIRRYLSQIKKNDALYKESSYKEEVVCRESPEGELHLSIAMSQAHLKHRLASRPGSQHRYCFSQGRHSGSFYLKIGAAVFCFGHLIHSGLLMGYQIVFLTSETDDFYNCASVPTLILDVIYPVFSFFQLFFIFKYSNVIINRCQDLGRFALMHCMASSVCFWFWTILRETMDQLNKYNKNKEEPASASAYKASEVEYMALPLTSYQRRGAQELIAYVNNTRGMTFSENCEASSQMTVIYEDFSPYLYPFTIEYSILI
ncbi:Uncharacterized protein GBIM_18441, partial [Gryllus bimaculatus]